MPQPVDREVTLIALASKPRARRDATALASGLATRNHAPPPAPLLPVRCERFVGAAAPNFCATLRSHTTRPTSQSSLRSPSNRPASAPPPPHPPRPALPLLAHRCHRALLPPTPSLDTVGRRAATTVDATAHVGPLCASTYAIPCHVAIRHTFFWSGRRAAAATPPPPFRRPPLPLLTHRCHRNRSALTRSLLLLPQRGLNQAVTLRGRGYGGFSALLPPTPPLTSPHFATTSLSA